MRTDDLVRNDLINMTLHRMHLSQSMETAAALLAGRCEHDEDFSSRFRDAPASVLAEYDISLSAREVCVHENDKDNWHLVLPDLAVRAQHGGLQRLGDSMLGTLSAAGGNREGLAAAALADERDFKLILLDLVHDACGV